MQGVRIAGVGMTPFTRSPGRGVPELARAAAGEALQGAGVPAADVSRIFFGNAAAGVISHQEMIRGQVALRNTDLVGTPVVNIENACASGGTALQLGWETIAAGRADVVLEPGAEATAEEIIAHCGNSLAGYKKPKAVDFVSELPISGYGKVLRREVRDRYWEGHERRVGGGVGRQGDS